MTDELPTQLRTACTTGDLPLATSQYESIVAANPLSSSILLSTMAVLSARHAHPDILSFTFTKGVTLNPELVNDPIIYAACDSGSVEVFKVLLKHGWDVNQYLEMSGCALCTACQSGNASLVRFLLENDADPNLGYASGDYEPLVWAIVGENAKLEIVELLLEHGVKIKGSGALIAAAEHGNSAVVDLLLQKKKDGIEVDLEEVEEYGGYYDGEREKNLGTALYEAAKEGHAKIVDMLLDAGSDVHFKTQKGKSPADIAEENGHADIAKKLRGLE